MKRNPAERYVTPESPGLSIGVNVPIAKLEGPIPSSPEKFDPVA